LFLCALIAGNLFTLWVHKNEPYYAAVGASGAVSGIVYSSILLYPGMQLMILPIPIPIPAPLFGFGFLMYSVYGMYKTVIKLDMRPTSVALLADLCLPQL
jgi:Rhomboid family.